MQLTLKFDAVTPVELPVDYGHLVQGMIYHSMEDPLLRRYLHEQGFQFEKRRFKLFTFSRLTGEDVRYNSAQKKLILNPPMKLVICSPIPFILRELGTGLLRRGRVRIGSAHLTVKEIATTQSRVESDRIQVRMLSPMTIYSTLPTADGRKYTYYYSPFEPKFNDIVGANLFKNIFNSRWSSGFRILFDKALVVNEQDQKITRYKGFIIKGWMGHTTARIRPYCELL